MRFSLQDPRLAQLRDEQTPVIIVLANGIRLHGRVESFDQFVIIIMGDEQQMVYKSAIHYIQLGRPKTLTKGYSDSAAVSRRRFTPIATENNEDRPQTRRKEPVVVVRKKLRTVEPPP